MVEDSVVEFGMEKIPTVLSTEKINSNGSLLSEFEILGSSDRGGDDYEEINKIRLTEKKEDSARLSGGGKVYKRIFIRRYRTCK